MDLKPSSTLTYYISTMNGEIKTGVFGNLSQTKIKTHNFKINIFFYLLYIKFISCYYIFQNIKELATISSL